VSGFDDQAQIRRKCSSIACSCSFLIRIWRREVVREFSWSLEHLSLVVRPVGVFDFLRHSLHLVDGVGDTDKVPPRNSVKRMTCCTHFTVDLVSSTNAVARHGHFASTAGIRELTSHGRMYRTGRCVPRDTSGGVDPPQQVYLRLLRR
jgi:hypothetical protein